MGTGITKTGGGLQRLVDMIARGKDKKAAFARVYPMYQALQVQRFETENASEGDHWADYKSKKYEQYKLKKFKTYPGAGSKMLVATGMLAGAVIGKSPGSPFTDGAAQHRAMFTSDQMIISVEESGENPNGHPFNYAHFVAVVRPFMSFSGESLQAMKDTVTKFVIGGK